MRCVGGASTSAPRRIPIENVGRRRPDARGRLAVVVQARRRTVGDEEEEARVEAARLGDRRHPPGPWAAAMRDRATGRATRGASRRVCAPPASPRRHASRSACARSLAFTTGRIAAFFERLAAHAAIASPRSAASLAAMGKFARRSRRGAMQRSHPESRSRRVEFAAGKDDGSLRESRRLLALDAEHLDRHPCASRTTTSVEASRAGGPSRFRSRSSIAPGTSYADRTRRRSSAARSSVRFWVGGRLHEPTRCRGLGEALPRTRAPGVIAGSGSIAAHPRSGQLDHGAPDAQSLERGRDAGGRLRGSGLHRTRSDFPGRSTSTFSKGTCGFPGTKAAPRPVRLGRSPTLSRAPILPPEAPVDRALARSRAPAARRSRSSTRRASTLAAVELPQVRGKKAQLHRRGPVRGSGLGARPGGSSCVSDPVEHAVDRTRSTRRS